MIGEISYGRAYAQKFCFSRKTSCRLVIENENYKFDDIFAFICHIRPYTSCDVTIAHANIAISMLKRYIVQP